MKQNNNTNPQFSVVFPVLNQEDHIEQVITTYHKTLTKEGFSFELIAVVNGSTDESFTICKRIDQQYPEVHAYNLAEKGFGLGILHGLSKSKGKYLCYLNSARIKPDDLIRILRYFLIDPTVLINGERKKREGLHRTLFSIFYNYTLRLIFRVPARDINGNPKAFSRETYNKLHLTSKNSMIDLEILENAKKAGIMVIPIPVFDYTRYGGKSTTSWHTIFRLIKEAAHYFFTTRLR